jgi:predicted nucleotidyltransferase
MTIESLRKLVTEDAYLIYENASSHSSKTLEMAREVVNDSLRGSKLDIEKICIVAVGSTARGEAMEASDVDLLPVWSGDARDFPHFEDLTGKVREDLRRATGLDVSTSRDLMRSTQLAALCRADGIGGDQDHRRTLTQRMLVLTESSSLGGELSISTVRRSILEAYVGDREIERTVSKHPLAVCNDIARYYRTLCVDYKSRAETKPESWAERHAKLRNARKFWYFSTLMAISKSAAEKHLEHHPQLFDRIESILSLPPYLRLLAAAEVDSLKYTKEILELYSKYLREMSSSHFRASLQSVTFEERDQVKLNSGAENPYREMHIRSREMSHLMTEMLNASSETVRQKVLDWFFL